MTIWRLGIACWVTKATNTHSKYVILIVFHCTKCCTQAPQCYITRALPVLVILFKIALCVLVNFVRNQVLYHYCALLMSLIKVLLKYSIIYIIHSYTTLYFINLYQIIIPATCFGPIVGPSSGCSLNRWSVQLIVL